jgi:Domain of unknown function (DUF1707)
VQVNIGPPDRNLPAALFPGALRASDADRERAIDTLKTAFVQGRLTRDELGLRTGRALESRTYTELAAATAGIPAVRTEARPWLKPAPATARKPVNKKVVAWGAAAIVLPTAIWAAFLTYYGGFFVLFLLALIGMAVSAGPSRHGFTSAPTGANIRRK